MVYIWLLSGLYMGWSLGANDPSYIFGTAILTKMIRHRTTVILLCLFAVIGAVCQGAPGMRTLSSITEQSFMSAFITAFVAASTILLMVKLRLPASTSQAMLGAIIGIGLVNGNPDLSRVPMVVSSWLLTPVGCIIITLILYPVCKKIFTGLRLNIFQQDSVLRWGLILVGCYGAYSLGANNIANVTGVYSDLIGVDMAIWIGIISVCIGDITFNKQVVPKILGKQLVRLDGFSAFITVIAMAIVMQIYAVIGIPVSAGQAIIGGMLGIGIIKGAKGIDVKRLVNIVLGWITTPAIACIMSFILYFLIKTCVGDFTAGHSLVH